MQNDNMEKKPPDSQQRKKTPTSETCMYTVRALGQITSNKTKSYHEKENPNATNMCVCTL